MVFKVADNGEYNRSWEFEMLTYPPTENFKK